jgi:salicylate hydroxylase
VLAQHGGGGGPAAALVPPTASNWLGPFGHVVHYYVQGGRAVNFVAGRETPDWTAESWTTPSSVEEPTAAFPGWHPRLATLFAKTGQVFK